MIRKIKKCECGSSAIECIQEDITVVTEVCIVNGQVCYSDQTNYDGGELYYRCGNCGKDFIDVKNEEQLIEYMKGN